MKVSWKWLSEFVDLSGITPQALAQRLTMTGFPVAGIEDRGASIAQVVVGRLKQVLPHPNADKLSLTEVEVPGQVLRIVCGAKNIAPGDVVPVALIGAKLPNGLEIREAKIRGELSQGMICSEKELGLSAEALGIMHLPAETPLGTPLAQVLGWDDVVLDLEITPNRSDCLSHVGIARHCSAVLDRPLKLPDPKVSEHPPAAQTVCSVEIEPGCGCWRYCGRVIQAVKIAPSPAWLQQRLEKTGVRPINNVVDVTNYVLMECGHPLHAFDLDRLEGHRVIARQARPQEMLVTLDGTERVLTGGELVIADAQRPIALAGVMGGKHSEVTEHTTRVLLEAAWFEPAAVRRSRRSTGCSSESSYRFERGTDPELTLPLSLDRASHLIAELTQGMVLAGKLDQYPEPFQHRHVRLRLDRARQVLGMPLDPKTSQAALERLGFKLETRGATEWKVRVPSYRPDVSLEEDLIEELAEVLGYDHIPLVPPRVDLIAPAHDPGRVFLAQGRETLVALGLNETIHYSFCDPAHFDRLLLPPEHPWRQALELRNPLSVETSRLRTSLLPNLIESVSLNQRRGRERIYLFELGAVFQPAPGEPLPHEPQHLGVVLSGPRQPMHWRQGKQVQATDFYDLKGVLDGGCERLQVRPLTYEPAPLPFLHPLISYRLLAPDGSELGWAGALHPESQERFKLREPLWAAELDLDRLRAFARRLPQLRPLSRFPSSVRDLALQVSEETTAGAVITAIRQLGGEALVQVVPFDLYRGPELPAGAKSLAFSLTFQAMDRTLQEEEVNTLQARIVDHLQKTFGAHQR